MFAMRTRVELKVRTRSLQRQLLYRDFSRFCVFRFLYRDVQYAIFELGNGFTVLDSRRQDQRTKLPDARSIR